MAERDDLDRLPSIAASPDDDPIRREIRRDTGPSAARTTSAPSAADRVGSSVPIPIIVVLALIISGGLSFAYVQTQQLKLANAQLTNSAERIKRLEEELNITGSTLSETSTAATQKISAQEAETKKLWDSSGRNRNAINETRRALGKTDSALGAVTGRSAALEALTSQQAKELEQQRALIARANEGIRTLVAANRELVDRLNATDQSARALRATLERRMRDNEEAIVAVDKFRQQINRSVSALSSDVAALRAAAVPKSG